MTQSSVGNDSVTAWIAGLKAGDEFGAEQLWGRYFRRLVGLARKKLAGSPRRMADEEDVALAAFQSFCLAAADGKFPQLRDRHNLWPLLVVIATRKAHDQRKYDHRLRRGGRGENGSTQRGSDSGEVEQALSREPTPEFAAMMAERCQRLLDQLDPGLRLIAGLKLEGDTNSEIAARIGCAVRTIERRLDLIRRHWEADLASDR